MQPRTHSLYFVCVASLFLLTYSRTHLLTSEAAELPSLFRGVVVADSPVGVRVVSVDEASPAARADVRPDDIIIRVNDQELHAIDEFAALSMRLKGRATSAQVLVFRDGSPIELRLHLFSDPILQAWGVEVVPDYDFRFADPRVGFEYWRRLGHGFEIAQDSERALNAYLNALHNVPTDTATALKASQLFCQISQRQLAQGRLADGTIALRHAVQLMEKLFAQPLDTEQLQVIRQQLQATLEGLRQTAAAHHTNPAP